MKNQFVILTGSKNNAGDYLIKLRAKQLFANLRPDREIIDINGWETLTEENLKIVNDSRALILMGGPALVENMLPNVYGISDALDKIKVPIIMMGLGWKSVQGNWENTYSYKLSPITNKLVQLVSNSGFLSSVRDYHTLNSLRFNNCDSVLMTGCPAYYDEQFIGTDFNAKPVEKVAFSLGVSFVESPSMEKLMKENILACRSKFADKSFEVVFHHSLDREKFKGAYQPASTHVKKHHLFVDWLEANKIKYVDISGSAENLMNYYSQVDLHIGYRVHAHIFMNSTARQTILISEDGRAKGVKGAIGGIVLNGYSHFKNGFISKVFNRLFSFYDRFSSNIYLTKELLAEIDYEEKTEFSRMKNSRKTIDSNYLIMQQFLKQLP
ncbi:MAG: polysaccharide pyruvyl transferase family protein [Crocinitomicaceae bacterium]